MQNRLHAALAGVALAAWLLFILACTGASWSPDGTRILFSYADPVAKQRGIAVYDLASGAANSLLLRAEDKSGSVPFAQWQRDGSRALIFTYAANDAAAEMTVLAMPVGSPGTARQFALPGGKSSPGLLPFPEIDGQLYVDGNNLARLNLETGEVKLERPKGENPTYLFSDESHLFYIRQTRKEESYDVGVVDPLTLALHRTFTVSAETVRPLGAEVKEILTIPVMDPKSGRIALMATEKETGVILLCTTQAVERVLRPRLPFDDFELLNLQWSRDGRALYATVVSDSADGKAVDIYLAEIPVDGSPVRLTRVVHWQGGSASDLFGLISASLSPDGETMALSLADFVKSSLPPEDSALYLIKVSDPEWRQTKVLPPVAPVDRSAPPEPAEPPRQAPPPPGDDQ